MGFYNLSFDCACCEPVSQPITGEWCMSHAQVRGDTYFYEPSIAAYNSSRASGSTPPNPAPPLPGITYFFGGIDLTPDAWVDPIYNQFNIPTNAYGGWAYCNTAKPWSQMGTLPPGDMCQWDPHFYWLLNPPGQFPVPQACFPSGAANAGYSLGWGGTAPGGLEFNRRVAYSGDGLAQRHPNLTVELFPGNWREWMEYGLNKTNYVKFQGYGPPWTYKMRLAVDWSYAGWWRFVGANGSIQGYPIGTVIPGLSYTFNFVMAVGPGDGESSLSTLQNGIHDRINNGITLSGMQATPFPSWTISPITVTSGNITGSFKTPWQDATAWLESLDPSQPNYWGVTMNPKIGPAPTYLIQNTPNGYNWFYWDKGFTVGSSARIQIQAKAADGRCLLGDMGAGGFGATTCDPAF